MATLYLASGSPRRRELLTQIGVPFLTQIAPIDENTLPGESPIAYVERLARAKGQAGLAALAHTRDAVVLGADTAVVLDGRILGKPADRAEAMATLLALSGRSHEVLTAVALVNEEMKRSGKADEMRHQEMLRAEMSLAYKTGDKARAQRLFERLAPDDKK